MENIATEISYTDSQGGTTETGKVGFRPLVKRDEKLTLSTIQY
jgi:hypothetical protein